MWLASSYFRTVQCSRHLLHPLSPPSSHALLHGLHPRALWVVHSLDKNGAGHQIQEAPCSDREDGKANINLFFYAWCVQVGGLLFFPMINSLKHKSRVLKRGGQSRREIFSLEEFQRHPSYGKVGSGSSGSRGMFARNHSRVFSSYCG